jgi:hypothetical protein
MLRGDLIAATLVEEVLLPPSDDFNSTLATKTVHH